MADWLRIAVALVVGAHGVGHVLFLVPLLGATDWGQSTHSWLLADGWPAKGLGCVIWLAVIVGFIGAAVGIFGEREWWRPLAVAASVVSAVGLLLYWAKPVNSPVASALVFNGLILGALLIFHWPPATQQ